MDIFDDFSEKLAGEVMADMADNYFGARKRLDDLVGILETFVENLKKKGEAVETRAGVFNALLTGETEAARFYDAIGVSSPETLLAREGIEDGVLDTVPDALTQKGRYVHTVGKVYDTLQKRCEDYLHGPPDYHPDDEALEEMEAHYELVLNMTKTINDQIEKINKSRSPGSMLQYVRGFQPDWDQKANIAGSNLVGFADGVDRKLVYKRIQFEDLGLKEYPDLPELGKVDKEIKGFCKDIYSRRKDAVEAAMAALRKTTT